MAVNCLVTLASLKLVFGSILSGLPSSRTPYPFAKIIAGPFFTSTAKPGSFGLLTAETIAWILFALLFGILRSTGDQNDNKEGKSGHKQQTQTGSHGAPLGKMAAYHRICPFIRP